MLSIARDMLEGWIQCPGNGTIVSLILLGIVAAIATGFYYLTKWLLHIVERLVLRSPTDWDDDLINPAFLRSVSQLAPAISVKWLLPQIFSADAGTYRWLEALTSLYIVVAITMIIVILLNNLYSALSKRDKLRVYAVKGVFQMLKLIFIGIAAIIAISIIIHRSPVAIITALGASAAVLMLVFRDTILGLVASVQLTANNMLRKGDWIVAEKYNANGEVIDVSLTTIKVKNWDQSVSTIPPYSLVSDSFRNYEPMRWCGGRRVDRAFYIDANTVRFLSADELVALHNEGWLGDNDIAEAGRIVNLGLLRQYLERYLSENPLVNTDMLYMVRQLAPTQSGLPIQLYFFTKTTVWKEYERAQSEIFDHVYAVVRRFGLAIYQTPAGIDFTHGTKVI